MCKGDAHGLDERRIRPIASMLANSALAATSMSGQRRRGRAWTGGPFVEMKCSTVCLMAACVNTGMVISGNFDSRVLYWLLVTAFRWSAGVLVAPRGTE